jgi:hypothetical protein
MWTLGASEAKDEIVQLNKSVIQANQIIENAREKVLQFVDLRTENGVLKERIGKRYTVFAILSKISKSQEQHLSGIEPDRTSSDRTKKTFDSFQCDTHTSL